MVEMLAISYSLQMYWSTVAHGRAMRTHDAQRDQVQRYELNGWKSPYQSEADAVEQAHRLADGYNRQFLRVLRHGSQQMTFDEEPDQEERLKQLRAEVKKLVGGERMFLLDNLPPDCPLM